MYCIFKHILVEAINEFLEAENLDEFKFKLTEFCRQVVPKHLVPPRSSCYSQKSLNLKELLFMWVLSVQVYCIRN